jgi:hypothetical protein
VVSAEGTSTKICNEEKPRFIETREKSFESWMSYVSNNKNSLRRDWPVIAKSLSGGGATIVGADHAQTL